MAWPRLANYFARFGLSLDMSCSLEVMAATLTKMPLFVRPPLEQQQRKRLHQQQQQQLLLQETEASQASKAAPVSKGPQDDDDDEDEETWGGVFDDQVEEEGEFKDNVRVESPTQDNTLRSIEDTAIVSPEETTEKKLKGNMQDDGSDSIKDMHRAVEVYLGQSVDPANLACSRQPIRNGNYQANKKRSRRRHTGPSLEVTLVVCGVREELGASQEEDYFSAIGGNDDDTRVPIAPPPRDAAMTIVRMVNRIPLLDGAEANSCGLVQGILQKRRVWNSFGLEVSSTGFQQQYGGRGTDYCNEEETFHQVPTLQVRDSEQVMPFLRNTNHSLLEDPFADDGSDTDSDDDDVDVEDLFTRKRRRKTGGKGLLPARVRLGDILVIVQIDAEPSQLPLPTLSKARILLFGLCSLFFASFSHIQPIYFATGATPNG